MPMCPTKQLVQCLFLILAVYTVFVQMHLLSSVSTPCDQFFVIKIALEWIGLPSAFLLSDVIRGLNVSSDGLVVQCSLPTLTNWPI